MRGAVPLLCATNHTMRTGAAVALRDFDPLTSLGATAAGKSRRSKATGAVQRGTITAVFGLLSLPHDGFSFGVERVKFGRAVSHKISAQDKGRSDRKSTRLNSSH